MKIEDVNEVRRASTIDEALSIQNEIEKKNRFEINMSELPSKGMIYPEGTKISLRKLKPSMMNKLSMMTVDNMDTTCNEILSGCVSGIDYKEIGVGDKWYLIYLLRDYSYKSRPFKVAGVCNNCGKNVFHDYTLKDLGIIHLSENFEKVIKLEESGDSVLIDLPRIKNEYVANSLKKDIIASKFDESIINLSINIGSVNGKELTPIEKCEYIEGLDPLDYSVLVNKLKETTVYGITFSATFTCDCGEKNEVVIPLNEKFFLPN